MYCKQRGHVNILILIKLVELADVFLPIVLPIRVYEHFCLS